MSILSELKKRAGPRVRFIPARSGRSNSGGEAVRMILAPSGEGRLGDLFAVARLLIHSGVSVRAAKGVFENLTWGQPSYVEAPSVIDLPAMTRAMAKEGVALQRIAPRPVDVKALRARLGISQEDFAGRFGLDVATVRNWEQGRTKPDGPAVALLHCIARDPDKIVELLCS